ncbi:hypothetical protein Bsp3421_000070 (plasmid) [Burkholderia sp. FERM BP-3421]|uniref:hypothetical protein n=1 Tax=Burkholderia sp. FERM BP-3421 TaxID=1494466 RepID=UPI00236285E1|nr:hypothetical protein [Burkholderia sp. FERM BP-3421]WDD90249.1 hypothetical protein Bsp3421_000070 [Burkholderia sp. FERM BP-3421]
MGTKNATADTRREPELVSGVLFEVQMAVGVSTQVIGIAFERRGMMWAAHYQADICGTLYPTWVVSSVTAGKRLGNVSGETWKDARDAAIAKLDGLDDEMWQRITGPATAERRRAKHSPLLPVVASSEATGPKLSRGEQAFMHTILAEAGRAPAGTLVPVEHTEGRAVSGLARKGLVIRLDTEAQLTEVGAAWLAAATSR